jgi:hypothetical protein
MLEEKIQKHWEGYSDGREREQLMDEKKVISSEHVRNSNATKLYSGDVSFHLFCQKERNG